MPHIDVPDGMPGIVGLLVFKPTTGARLAGLMHELLRGDGPLSTTERELIAAYVSTLDGCRSLEGSAAAGAGARPPTGPAAELDAELDASLDAFDEPDPDPRLGALLRLAAAVVSGGSHVTDDMVAAARAAGAGDEDIHDTVLLAAAFCMVNRYVDGLATVGTRDDDPRDDDPRNDDPRNDHPLDWISGLTVRRECPHA